MIKKTMRTIYITLILLTFFNGTGISKIWLVSPDGEYKFCSEVSNLVSDNDTIEINSGVYENDKQVTWTKNNLLIRGVDKSKSWENNFLEKIANKPILRAGSIIANDNSNGKGIFVIRGNNTTVENIEFQNAKVQSRNGAGIRQEGSKLIVRHCVFNGNEMGILQGGSIQNCSILVEFCKFTNCGSPENPGFQHNIYINHIDTLIFRFNYTHDAIAEGHEFKSRANNNFILYNRISNFNSVDSRNIDLPNGGTAVIVGNIIEQGENSANSNIIGFGLEGLVNPGPHNLWISSNTIVNKKSKGSFVNIASIDTLFMKNNICVGAKTRGFIIGTPAFLDTSNNIINDNIDYPLFANVNGNDYHLTEESPANDSGIDLEYLIKGIGLIPQFVYKDTADFEARFRDDKIDIGAYEYVSTNSAKEDTESEEAIFSIKISSKDDLIYFSFDSEIKLINLGIFDILGNQVFSNSYPMNDLMNTIDLSSLNLKSGIYFAIFSSNSFTKCKKLLLLR